MAYLAYPRCRAATGEKVTPVTAEIEHGDLEGTTWYGLPFRIRDNSWCDLVVAGLPMPHPSLVNAVIRRGLDQETKWKLVRNHERGHLETLPFVLPYLVALLRRDRKNLTTTLVGLLGLEALWELLTESYVLALDPKAYRENYKDSHNLSALLFWPATALGALAPWLRKAPWSPDRAST